MDVNQAIVKILEDLGRSQYVFGSIGQVNDSMLLALRDSKKIQTIIVKNEQAASFMACGYTMFNPRHLGVCFTTGGGGAFELFSGMAVAYSDSLPVLVITGYVPISMRGKGCLNESSGLNRTPDSHKMFAATTKKSYIVEDASQICDIMEKAIHTAFNGRPGPVHIHVPKDITTAQVPNFREVHLKIAEVIPRQEAVLGFAIRLAKALQDKEKILLLIGYGCIRSEAHDTLEQIIHTFNIPYITTMDAKGYLDESDPLSFGIFGSTGDPRALAYFKEADIVLALGNSFAENATLGFNKELFHYKTLMHINIDKDELNKVYVADYSMIADIKPALKMIYYALVSFVGNQGFTMPILPKEQKWTEQVSMITSDKIHPALVSKIIGELAPSGTIIMGDAGAPMLWLSEYMQLTKGQHYQNPGSFGPMTSHTNGAIGVKCANPDKVVIVAVGDGGYLMAGFELLTAVVNQIPVIWVIFNNGECNVIKKFLFNRFNERAYLDFINPDYVAYAKSCGAQGYHVETLEGFRQTLEQAIKLNQPVLIDVKVDDEVYPNMHRSM